MFTNQLRDNPYSVVLLDEIEKASPALLNLFLQAFDEGWITDGRGRRVYLSDAVVIMTSNLGAEHFRKIENPLGFRHAEVGIDDVRGEVMRELERRLSPEFRNRLDEVIVFAPLTRDEAAPIAGIQLDRVIATAIARGKEVEITPEALDEIVREGYSLAYGARFLKRVIDDRVKIPLSQMWGAANRFSRRRVRRRGRGRGRRAHLRRPRARRPCWIASRPAEAALRDCVPRLAEAGSLGCALAVAAAACDCEAVARLQHPQRLLDAVGVVLRRVLGGVQPVELLDERGKLVGEEPHEVIAGPAVEEEEVGADKARPMIGDGLDRWPRSSPARWRNPARAAPSARRHRCRRPRAPDRSQPLQRMRGAGLQRPPRVLVGRRHAEVDGGAGGASPGPAGRRCRGRSSVPW